MSFIYILFLKITFLTLFSHSRVLKKERKVVYKNLIVKEVFDQYGNQLYTGNDRKTDTIYSTEIGYKYITVSDDDHHIFEGDKTFYETDITDTSYGNEAYNSYLPSDSEPSDREVTDGEEDEDEKEVIDEKKISYAGENNVDDHDFHNEENIDEDKSSLNEEQVDKECHTNIKHKGKTSVSSHESIVNNLDQLEKIQKGDLKSYQDNYEDFVDGKYSCDHFPEGNGVIRLDHLNLGGWSGTYYPPDTSTNGPCIEGTYCSYSCQSGMLKTQWPKEQPENGVSVGGLLCKDGKLHRSNKDYDLLCIWGENKAIVVNQLNERVSICGTDYPGTENMVLPTVLDKNQSSPLSVVNMKTYYKWRNMQTSAQYYVNHAGVDFVEGCSWGSPKSEYGNWSPINFGAGYIDGLAYLSLIPNPNNKKPLNFNVKIVPDGDDSVLNGNCVYENGVFIGNDNGCTTTVTKGRGKFVLYY